MTLLHGLLALQLVMIVTSFWLLWKGKKAREELKDLIVRLEKAKSALSAKED